MQKIKARLLGSDDDLGKNISTVTVRGCELSREFSEHEVDEETFGKLKGNPFVEVLVPKPGRSAGAQAGEAPAAAPEPKPEAEG